jgi:hypothetical protein
MAVATGKSCPDCGRARSSAPRLLLLLEFERAPVFEHPDSAEDWLRLLTWLEDSHPFQHNMLMRAARALNVEGQ